MPSADLPLTERKDFDLHEHGHRYSGTWRGHPVGLFEFSTKHWPWGEDESRVVFYSCVVGQHETGKRGALVESSGLRRVYQPIEGHQPYAVFGWRQRLPEPLREWLKTLDGNWGFSVDDPWVFCYATPQFGTADELRGLLEMLAGFIARFGEPLPPPHI